MRKRTLCTVSTVLRDGALLQRLEPTIALKGQTSCFDAARPSIADSGPVWLRGWWVAQPAQARSAHRGQLHPRTAFRTGGQVAPECAAFRAMRVGSVAVK